MTTLFVTQPLGMGHIGPQDHPERGERLQAIEKALSYKKFDGLLRREAPSIDLSIAEIVHDAALLQKLRDARPMEGLGLLDGDTYISQKSFAAAGSAVGGALAALDAVILSEAHNGFCAIRPPGHHAEKLRPMGFCLVNTVAITARQAQRKYGAERIAIVDFDVHHGNGTQDIFYDDPSVLFASSHQMPLFPGTGDRSETGAGNIFNAPLDPMSAGEEMRLAYTESLLPAIDRFAPDLILISAGFDADRRDPLSQLRWNPGDFSWITGKLMDLAEKHCNHRIVSLLEGGYDLKGLSEGVAAHVTMLQSGTSA